MRCHSVSARLNWREQVASRGYDVALLDHPPCWIESVDEPFCAVFSGYEIDRIREATERLTKAALSLVDEVCCSASSESYFARLQIAPQFRECIRRSWKRHDKSLYGRFDFALNGDTLKLLELDFDTPTSLYESAHLQRMWLEMLRPLQEIPFTARQNNSIQEKLAACLSLNFAEHDIFYLGTFEHSGKEIENLKYVQSCAELAGMKTQFVYLDEVRYDKEGLMLDRDGQHITCLFKLSPWKTLFERDLEANSKGGKYLYSPLVMSNRTTFVEPAWSSILSKKVVLPLLFDLSSDREFLLESKLDENNSDSIVQAFTPLSRYRDFQLNIGSWVVADQPAGICVRADNSKITGRNALFVPHYVTD